MTWEDIIRKGMIKGHKDYKMYFSFFDGEALPFGSVVEYTGSRKIPLPTGVMRNEGNPEIVKGNRYKIVGANYSTIAGDYVLNVEDDSGFVSLPRRMMVEDGRNFKVISRGSEEQRNISVPRKK